MNLLLVGCSYRTAPVAVRERLALPEPRVGPTLSELLARFGGEALILSTCNRLELYAVPDAAAVGAEQAAAFLAECQQFDLAEVRPLLYEHHDAAAVHHLFRVAASWCS